MSTRLVQLAHGGARHVALVEEPHLRLLSDFASVYALAKKAAATGESLTKLAGAQATGERLDYGPIYEGKSAWRLLAPMDHPEEAARCVVSGTGLTHLGSAKNRQAMHGAPTAEMTDSMKMFRAGVEGGRPAAGKVGVAPEWFYKGVGTILRGPNEPLVAPPYAEDGGEEAEMAGVYIIGEDGQPCRVGLTPGNEFSDHKFERKNYLNLAGSKLRTCAIGPEIVIDCGFQSVAGTAAIERGGRVVWRQEIATGEAEMCHSLANIEHHHFKFETHCRPGDAHVHYFGAHSLSFGDGFQLADGDVMVVQWAGFGRALRNPLRVAASGATPVTVRSLA